MEGLTWKMLQYKKVRDEAKQYSLYNALLLLLLMFMSIAVMTIRVTAPNIEPERQDYALISVVCNADEFDAGYVVYGSKGELIDCVTLAPSN